MPKYDVAVVGAGLGGLAAAALLAGKKKKTIVFERGVSVDNATGVFKKDGFTFFVAPALSYGFEPGGELHELSARLGLVQEISVPSPCYQVALPDRRITIYAEWSDTLEELRREFPREINTLARFYRELHKEAVRNTKSRVSSYLSKHRAAAGFLRTYRFSRELTAFFDLQSLFFFQKPAEDLSFASLITLCDITPRSLHGGFKKLADQLYGIILREGGDVICNEKVSGLVTGNDRIIGLKTTRGVVEAGAVLLNTVQHRLSSTLFIGLRNEVVPVGMCRHALFLPDYTRPREFFSLSLNAEDDAAAPPGMRTLNASYRSQRNFAVDKQALLEHVNTLIPFLNDYLVFAEEHRGDDGEPALLENISFQPLRSADGLFLLSRGSQKNIYLLNNAQNMPLQALAAAQRFAGKMI